MLYTQTINDITLYIAFSLWEKTRGIIGRESLVQTGALVLPCCNWVHSFFVQSSLNLYFFNADYDVLVLRTTLHPNCVSPFVYKAHHVIESALNLDNYLHDIALSLRYRNF